MSLWSRLGSLGKGTLDWVGDVGLGLASIPKLAWDLTTAFNNDREEFNGFTNILKQSGIDWAKNATRPIGGVLAAVEATNRNLIREPLSAVTQFGMSTPNDKNLSAAERWQRSWENRNQISFGQALATQIGQATSFMPDSITPDFMDSNFDIYDKKQRDKAFNDSLYGRVLSGSIDTVLQFAGDVTIVGGKFVAAGRAVDTAADAIVSLRQARSTINMVPGSIPLDKKATRYGKLAEDFANNDTAWAMNHPWVKAGNNQATVSYLLGISKTKEEALNTMLSVLGDTDGMSALKVLKRPDIEQPLRIASGEMDIVDLDKFIGQEAKLTATTTDDMLQFAMRSEEEILKDREFLTAWAKHDTFVNLLLGIETTGAPMSEGISRFGQFVGAQQATARSISFHAREVAAGKITMYQPTPFHRLHYVVNWLGGERPSGVVNLNDGDSIKEVIAVANRLIKLSKPSRTLSKAVISRVDKTPVENTGVVKDAFTEAEAVTFIERYTAAGTPEARALVINDLEKRGYKIISDKHGVDSDTAEQLYDYHNKLRSGKLRESKEEGFMFDKETNQMIKVPIFESQTANFLPMADFDKIDSVIKQNSSLIQATRGNISDAVGYTSDLWKAAVLLRLGYPVRNAVDSQLRIWATVGAMASLRHAVEGSRNLVFNTKNKASRLIDEFNGVEKPDYKTVKNELQATGAEIAKLEKEVASLTKQLANDPENPDLIGKITVVRTSLATKSAVYESNSQMLTKIEQSKMPQRKKRIGEADFDLNSTIDDIDGTTYTVHGAFGGPNGGLFRELNSSQQTFYSLLEDYSAIYGANVASKGRGAVRPGDLNYYQEWASAINEVFGNSKVARALMNNESVEEVTKKLIDDSALRARLGLSREGSKEYVERAQKFLDAYIPSGTGIREEILGPYATLKSKFPYLQDYKDGGMGGLPETKSVVGFVDTNYLAKMPGNITDKEGVDFYVKKLRSGQGFDNPIMVIYDNETGLAFIGEGNHRLQAAIKEGLSAVPVRVVRGRVDETKKLDSNGIALMADTVGRKPMQVKNGKTLPFTTRGTTGEVEYMPTDVHPSYIFDKEFIVNPSTLEGSKVNEEFLRNAIKDPDKLPVVHGHLLEANINLKPLAVPRRMTNFLFKYLATMPEDNLARHPLFIDLYERSIKKRLATEEFLQGGTFTREEFDAIQYRLTAGARADALKGVKETLYNVERRTNAAHFLRFISPFFSAQENAVKTWLKIATDKPVILSRANIIWNAPNRAGMITDEKGNPVPTDQVLSPNDTMWFPIPKALKKLPIIGEGLSSLDQVGISKKSLDVIFQGNPFGVGLGPFAAIPVANILKLKPEWSEVVSFAFPFGPDASPINNFLPTWAKRSRAVLQGLDSDDYAKSYQLIWLTEQHKAREEGRPYLTDGEIKSKTDAFYKMRTAAALILPFAPQFDSPYRLHMDKWREYSELYGLDADAKFLQDYPEFFDFATSLSKNPTGARATLDDVKNAKEYSSLIADVSDDNMYLVGLITRGSGQVKFNPTAYWWQQETTISPGTPEKFRGRQDPKEAQAKNQAREGWAKYRMAMTIIDANLAKRGLTSITQNGAEDLLAAKNAVVQTLGAVTDPVTGKSTGEPSAWLIDYRDVDGTKTARTVIGFKKILSNKKFMDDNANSPTWKSISLYMKVRDSLAVTLSGRPSGNIDAKENADVRAILDYYVNQLKVGDLEFSNIYDRFLSQDRIYDKYLGLGT